MASASRRWNMDPIDHVLEGLKLESSIFSRMELGGGWGFAKGALAGAPFHIVIDGEAWVGSDRDALTRLCVGEMAVLPRGQAHLLLSAPDAEAVPFKQIAARMRLPDWEPGVRLKPMVLRVGPPGPTVTRLVSGVFEFRDRRRNPLLTALPDLLVLRTDAVEAARGTPLDVAMMIDREIGAAQPGARLVAGRLADRLFIQAVREHLVSSGQEPAGWLRGLRDPVVGRALSLLHARPEQAWSVEALAQEVNMSRSQFAERFRQQVGRGPIDYLREWRMFTAAGWLADGRMSLKEIAGLTGYRSAAAFGRAFKDWGGTSPAAVRREGSAR